MHYESVEIMTITSSQVAGGFYQARKIVVFIMILIYYEITAKLLCFTL